MTRVDLQLLTKELAAAGIAVPNGLASPDGQKEDVHTFDDAMEPAPLPPGSQPVVDAHVAPPLVFDYVETREVAARLTTTDGTFHEVYRLATTPQTMYRATFTMSAIDAGSFDVKDAEARLVFKRTASQLLQVGATIALGTAQDTAAAGWAIQAQASGTELVIGVRGASGRTIDWILAGDVASFAPSGVGPGA